MSVVLDTVVPVFAVIALGFWLAGRSRFDLPTLADLAVLVTSPALIFSVLSGTRLVPAQLASLAGGALWVVAGTAGLAVAYLRLRAPGRRGLLMPAVFWNAGNMALPCARLAFGEPGLAAASIVFVTMAVLSSSLAVWIAKGEGGAGEVLRMPLVYASVGGLAMALAGAHLPRMLMEPVEMVGAMAIPLMLLNLGMQLRRLRVTDFAHSLAAVVIRMGGGLAFALLFVAWIGVGGVDRQVLLLESLMPPAVINVVLAQRYGTDPALVASSIVIGTGLSLLAIPALIYAVA